MRVVGRLLLVLLAAAVLATFFLPQLLAPYVADALRARSLEAGTLEVRLDAFPPQELLLGRVDVIHVTATSVVYRGVEAARLTADVSALDLLTGGSPVVSATLSQAVVAGVPVERVDIAGPLAGARFTALVAATDAAAAIASQLGLAAGSVVLSPPDLVTVTIGGRRVTGRLAAAEDGRGLTVAVAGLTTGSIVALEAASPLRIRAAAIGGDGVTLTGSVDLGGW